MTSLILGGGRETKDSSIDLTVGIRLHKKLGDLVHEGDTLAVLYANDSRKLAEAKERLQKAYVIGAEKPAGHKHVYAIVTKDGVELL
jgi:pyrimidine-nucleoside phosphorylase